MSGPYAFIASGLTISTSPITYAGIGGGFAPAPEILPMLPTATKLSFDEVPVVDLAGLSSGRAAVAAELAEACGRVGFVYLKNHGVPSAEIGAIFKTAQDFHNLPLEAKMDVSITKNTHAQGYLHGMSKGVHETISANLQEAFQIRRPLPPDDPGILAGKPLHGVIPWPGAMPDLEPRMMRYYALLDRLGYQVLDLFELGLELEPGTLRQYFRKDMNS